MGHEQDRYQNYRFPGQKGSEQIRLLISKHWIIGVKLAFTFLALAVFPILIAGTAGFLTWDGSFNDLFLTTVLGFLLYFLTILLILYIKWLNEELDVIIATDERVISHEQIDLFHRQVSETNLTQIQDVTGIENGFLQSILHYGTVEIQTSSSDVFFTIIRVSQPHKNARALLDLRDAQLRKLAHA